MKSVNKKETALSSKRRYSRSRVAFTFTDGFFLEVVSTGTRFQAAEVGRVDDLILKKSLYPIGLRKQDGIRENRKTYIFKQQR